MSKYELNTKNKVQICCLKFSMTSLLDKNVSYLGKKSINAKKFFLFL